MGGYPLPHLKEPSHWKLNPQNMFMSKKFLFQLIIWYRFSQCLSNSFIIYNFVKFKLHREYLLSCQWGYILPYWKPNSMLRFSPLFQADSLSPERFLFTLIFKKNTRNISSSLYLTKFEKNVWFKSSWDYINIEYTSWSAHILSSY